MVITNGATKIGIFGKIMKNFSYAKSTGISQMLYLLAFHIIFVVCWFAGLFYLPRLFVYHAQATDAISLERFKVMERRLYRGIMVPCAILATLTGIGLLTYAPDYLQQGWMHVKLTLVIFLWAYQLWCGQFIKAFRNHQNTRSQTFYRVFNEIPTLLLIAIVLLVVVKP